MSSTTASTFHVPTVEVTERSDGHLLPMLTGIAIVLVTALISIAIVGLPH